MASSYEYKDGVVGILPFRLVLQDNSMYEDSTRPRLYHIYATFHYQVMNGRRDVSQVVSTPQTSPCLNEIPTLSIT